MSASDDDRLRDRHNRHSGEHVPAPQVPTPGIRRSGVMVVAGWLLTAALIIVAVLVVTARWEAVGEAGGLPGWEASAAAVAAFATGNALLAHTWRAIVALTGRRLTFGAAAWVWSVSQLARYTVGAAQVGGRALAGRRYGVPATAGAASTLVEIGWQLSLMAVLLLATVPWWLPTAGTLRWLAWLAAVPVFVLLIGLAAPQRLVDALTGLGRRPAVRAVTGGRFASAAITLSRTHALRVTVLYTLNMALRVAGFLAVFAALGGSVRDDGLAAAGAYALGQLVGWAAVFAPGGLGPREGATALVLTPLVGGGPAVVIVAAVRLLEVVAELLFLAVARALRSRPSDAAPTATAGRSAP